MQKKYHFNFRSPLSQSQWEDYTSKIKSLGGEFSQNQTRHGHFEFVDPENKLTLTSIFQIVPIEEIYDLEVGFTLYRSLTLEHGTTLVENKVFQLSKSLTRGPDPLPVDESKRVIEEIDYAIKQICNV